MSELSFYMQTQILNWIKGTNMPAAPANVYVALFDGDPGGDGLSGTEVTTDVRSAGRVAASFGSESSGVISNSSAVDFGTSDSAVSVTHFALFDAASDGNMIGRSVLNASREVEINDPVEFQTGDLSVNMRPTLA